MRLLGKYRLGQTRNTNARRTIILEKFDFDEDEGPEYKLTFIVEHYRFPGEYVGVSKRVYRLDRQTLSKIRANYTFQREHTLASSDEYTKEKVLHHATNL